MKPSQGVLWLIVIATACKCIYARVYDCPLNWDKYNGHCYHFVKYPTRTYQQAEASCAMDSAALVSVNDGAEHQFILNWLAQFDVDKNNEWYTSGLDVINNENIHVYQWQGDGTGVPAGDFWTSDQADFKSKDLTKLHLVYKFSVDKTAFAWDWEIGYRSLSYICEITQEEAFRINQPLRDYAYGHDQDKVGEILKGPRFTTEPVSVIVTSKTQKPFFDCVASGNPLPTYKWYKNFGTTGETEITSATNPRYTLTNGRFSITGVNLTRDVGDYQCTAENSVGSVISDPVSLSRGYLNEFSNFKPGSVRAPQYQGTVIYCNTPSFNPKIVYVWYKTDTNEFIRPSLNPHTFISENGRLYISELQASDQGEYHCIISLAVPFGYKLATQQPPSETSLGIQLIVTGENANIFGPEIHNDFPAVFPNPPFRGQEIRIECLAYGRLPMHYSWKYNGGPIQGKARLENLNRILIIPNAELEDSGNYTCNVRRSDAATDSKTFILRVVSKPYFMFPLKDKFVDRDSQVTLRCEAVAVPRATYTWYRDTKVLTSVPGDIEIYRNTVVIKSVNADRHNGMYQCAANNKYGTTFSSGELRVLVLKPSFAKHPLSKSMIGTERGNITIPCLPEAAPIPEIRWYHNGGDLGLTPEVKSGNKEMLLNGALRISSLNQADTGDYKCTATNSEGSASSNGHLSIIPKIVITTGPTSTPVNINNTAFLFCEASYDAATTDLIYIWKFNGHTIDPEENPYFIQGVRDNTRGLYIRNAQFKHTGNYTCIAETAKDRSAASAFLTVLGAPGQPAGVYAHAVIGTKVELRWTLGPDHGDAIREFWVEGWNNYNQTWTVLLKGLPAEHSLIENEPTKRGCDVTGLGANTSYMFRVGAKNSFGWGEPSQPSKWYRIQSAPPGKAPSHVRGGGGKVGVLTIKWEPLALQDRNGPGFNYNVFWRRKENAKDIWSMATVDGIKSSFVKSLTDKPEDMYIQFEVKVRAHNNLGFGPNSTIAIVYSSEHLPPERPGNVRGKALNSTAATIYWTPVPDDRQHAAGRILGYQINWWRKDQLEAGVITQFSRQSGQSDHGVIIGLRNHSDYWFNVKVYNSAGIGPKSDDNWVQTYHHAPLHYPEFVNVSSHTYESVRVTWRGVSPGIYEEPIRGYKLLYREKGTEMSTARVKTVLKVNEALLDKIERGKIYVLRMMGYSNGGDGKKSPSVYFTTGGALRKLDVSKSELVYQSGHRSRVSIFAVAAGLIIVITLSTW